MRKQVERFLDAKFFGQGSGLQHRADALLEFFAALLRVETAHSRHAAIGCAHSLEDFDCCRLPRAVRPEQAKDFPLFHAEADAPQCLHGSIALVEVFDLDYRLAHGIISSALVRVYFYTTSAMRARISELWLACPLSSASSFSLATTRTHPCQLVLRRARRLQSPAAFSASWHTAPASADVRPRQLRDATECPGHSGTPPWRSPRLAHHREALAAATGLPTVV